jgi:hypothetical protein
MPITNMPAALIPLIQTGYLEHAFQQPLTSGLGYRAVADRVDISVNIGETLTKTRFGLKAPKTTPLVASTNTNFDNGLTAASNTIEQYAITMNQYGDSIDLNVVTSQAGLANQFLMNATVNGQQAKQTLDRLCRNALFAGVSTISSVAYGGYLGGSTKVRTTLGAPATTINVDDVRGFEVALTNGVFSAVSAGNPANVTVGSNVYVLNGTTRDGGNVTSTVLNAGSTDINGVSGTLIFSGNVTVADATAGNAIVHANAPSILRAGSGGTGLFGGRSTWGGLVAGDVLKAQTIANAIATLRNNTGLVASTFKVYLDNISMVQLFADSQFQLAYQGQYGAAPMRGAQSFELYGATFIPVSEAPTQTFGALTIRRPIVVADGALVEGDFAGMTNTAANFNGADPTLVSLVDGVAMVTREPMDRFGQIVAQSWYWMGGFGVPTDATATQAIIPTANSAYLKRAVVIEHI